MGTSENPTPAPKASDLLIVLAKNLTAQTLSGKVKWSLADSTGEKFIYSIPDASVIISSSNLNLLGSTPTITLTVRDAHGVIMETLSTEQSPSQDMFPAISVLPKVNLNPKISASVAAVNQTLQDLYGAARSQALQPEAVIKKILGELGAEESDT